MRGWRSKLIFTLIVYVAGFATAIHMLAPPPEGQTDWHSDNNSSKSQFDSEEFVKDFNSGMHKCFEFGKEAALRTAKLLREKYKEMRDV